MRARGDDKGAVAVIVALVVTLVLIPVAALAVDLGSVYVREGSLQATADGAARAGAEELALLQRGDPDAPTVMAAARTKAVQTLCAGVRSADDPWAAPCTEGSPWAADGDPSNGEISFYLGAPSAADHTFDPTTQDADGALAGDLVTGIRVVTPPSRVTFGLAGAFTDDHADPQKAATAGIFTVLPRAGFFPMFLRPGEHGGFCTRSAPKNVWYPTAPLGCTSVARGYLTAPRTKSTENANAMVWNTATGFDVAHLPLPGTSATFDDQRDPSSLVRDLSPGLFGGTGSYSVQPRLKGGACPGGYNSASHLKTGLESAFLTDFLDLARGDKLAFRAVVKDGIVPSVDQQGWLTANVLRCGRLGVVPVLTGVPTPMDDAGLPSSSLSYPVSQLRLVWLDDRLWDGESESNRVATGYCLRRGFFWADEYYPSVCEDALRAYTGYVLDPLLLPATVADSSDPAKKLNALDSYVGSGLPVTIRLLRDVSDPPPR